MKSLGTCPINYDIDNCSSKERGLDCSTCCHINNLTKKEIADILKSWHRLNNYAIKLQNKISNSQSTINDIKEILDFYYILK